jgi:hypothetical protein
MAFKTTIAGGDTDGGGKIGLNEAIKALQMTSGGKRPIKIMYRTGSHWGPDSLPLDGGGLGWG